MFFDLGSYLIIVGFAGGGAKLKSFLTSRLNSFGTTIGVNFGFSLLLIPSNI